MRFAALFLLALSCAPKRAPIAAREAVDPDVYLCRYKKVGYHLAAGELSLGPSEAAVLTLPKEARSVGVELTVPWENDLPMRAKVTTGWVTYEMFYRPAAPLKLYALTPQKAGVFELGQYTELEYLGNAEKQLRMRVVPPSVFTPAAPIELRLKCPDTGILPNGKGLQAEEPRADGGVPDVLLSREVEIPVAENAGAPAAGTLKYEKDARPRAVVLDTQGDAVRIRIGTWPGRVTGWVPKRFTAPWVEDKDGMSSIFGMGGLGLRGTEGDGKPAWARCVSGVPLYLVRNGELVPAGQVWPKAAYEVVREAEAWTEIALPENAWLGAPTWALAPGDLEKCRTMSPSPP